MQELINSLDRKPLHKRGSFCFVLFECGEFGMEK